MVAKSYSKSLLRMFKANSLRLFSITLIIAIGIMVASGIASLAPQMREAIRLLEIEGIRSESSMMFLREMADSIEIIGIIFPVFFILVSVLVVFITMTRLIEEERGQVGCFKTLGYSRASVMFKYVFFALVACILGSTIGLVFGNFVLSPILYFVISTEFNLPAISGFFLTEGMLATLFMFVFVVGITFFVVFSGARERPANLLKPKSPKAGKKIVLEHMPFVWNGLKFRYKSTLRNLFRFKTRFFMTVFSIMGVTALIFCGMGLYFVMAETNADLIGMIIPISIALTICAAMLGVLVIYNLTNINIEERRREIATLKVLGYRNIEVSGYIFREIAILAFIGIAIGLPLGYFSLIYLIHSMRFGDASALRWYVWLIAATIALTSTAITDLLLFRKIHKMDMLSSLKAAE